MYKQLGKEEEEDEEAPAGGDQTEVSAAYRLRRLVRVLPPAAAGGLHA